MKGIRPGFHVASPTPAGLGVGKWKARVRSEPEGQSMPTARVSGRLARSPHDPRQPLGHVHVPRGN